MSGTGFAASISLANLPSGITISAPQVSGAQLGRLAGVGDVNGDGFDDFLVGAPQANGGAGFTTLVFGKASGWANLELPTATAPATVDFTAGGRLGFAVSGLGDVNGDGLADLMVTAPIATAAGRSTAGIAYVLFGRTTGWADLDLTTLTGGSSGGFQILGPSAAGNIGMRAARMLGDVNGDGFADMLVMSSGGVTAFAYLVFGKAGGEGNANWSNLDLATAPASAAVRVHGFSAGGTLGSLVAGIGDLNGDGFADFAWGDWDATVGANTNAGALYIRFGAASLANMDFLAPMSAGQGLVMRGAAGNDQVGLGVSSAGDVNGDGLTDLLVGGSNKVWLIFGRAGSWSDINVGALEPGAGVMFSGAAGLGGGVTALGDVNGDGFDDFALAAPQVNVGGQTSAGQVFVVYGKASGWSDQNFGTSVAGVSVVSGAAPGQLADGSGRNVSFLGDLDGDGFADLGIGASLSNAGDGAAYVLFSQAAGSVIGTGTTLADTIRGTAGDDTLTGYGQNDTLLGFAGHDTIEGGSGNDLMDGGAGNDTLTYAGATSGVTVSLGVTGPQATGGAGTDTASGFEVLVGSAFADTLTGSAGDDTVVGGAGNDALEGGAGNDTLSYADAGAGVTVSLGVAGPQATGAVGTDTVSGFETLLGSAFADTLGGGSGAETLLGGAGNDTLDGGAGNDWLDGGADIDTLSYATATSGVTFSLAIAGAQATGGAGTDTATGFENLLGSASEDVLTGDGGANRIQGSDGDDTVDGGAGDDSLDGGAGNDTLSYASAASGVSISMALLAAGQDTAAAGFDAAVNFERVLGSGFDDIFSSGAGNDVMDGGAGSDTVTYAGAAASVTVSLGINGPQNTGSAGTDTLSGFEVLVGSAFADTLTGGSADDTIIGGAGNDVLEGGSGTDMVSYAGATSRVTVSLGITAPQDTGGAGTDTLSGFEALVGSRFKDTLSGGPGNDTLDGGGADDAFLFGPDIVSYAAATAGVTVSLAITGPQDTRGAGTDTLRNVAGLEGSAFGDTLSGDAGPNTIHGGGGNDTIEGGDGNDTLNGGDGLDTLSYANATAGVRLLFVSNVLSVTKSTGTDVLTGIGTGAFEAVLGSAFDDTLIGGVGGALSTLDGGAGNDVLGGSSGNTNVTVVYASAPGGVTVSLATTAAQDTVNAGMDRIQFVSHLRGSAFGDVLTGGAGLNRIWGGDGADTIDGLGGTDTLDGEAGDDALRGGTGNDVLIGGSGNDVLNGGFGIDAANFVGNRSDYSVTKNPGRGWTVARAGEADQVTSVESIRFGNGNQIQNLSYGRPEDVSARGFGDIQFQNVADGWLFTWTFLDGARQGQGALGGPGAGWDLAGKGDFNNDGASDLLWRNAATGDLYAWLMRGLTKSGEGGVGTLGAGQAIGGVGDTDGDRRADIVQVADGLVTIRRMDGTTTLSVTGMSDSDGTPFVALDAAWSVAAVTDFDGDLRGDILWRNASTGQLYLWQLNGSTVVAQGSYATPGAAWRVVGAADLDGDGRADVVLRNDAGWLWAYITDPTSVAGGANGWLGAEGGGYTLQKIADYTGDDLADLLFYQSSTGFAFLQSMDGLSVLAQQGAGQAGAGFAIL